MLDLAPNVSANVSTTLRAMKLSGNSCLSASYWHAQNKLLLCLIVLYTLVELWCNQWMTLVYMFLLDKENVFSNKGLPPCYLSWFWIIGHQNCSPGQVFKSLISLYALRKSIWLSRIHLYQWKIYGIYPASQTSSVFFPTVFWHFYIIFYQLHKMKVCHSLCSITLEYLVEYWRLIGAANWIYKFFWHWRVWWTLVMVDSSLWKHVN